MNITGTGGVTRIGRIFTPVPPVIDNGGTSSQDKGKQIEGNQQRHDSTPTSEVEEFLHIIKKSDYKVVNQLNQTLSKISMMYLLMCSEAHRDALVKFLRVAHVPQDIYVFQFKRVVNNIASSVSLGFIDNELPPEGRNHNKALHIYIECVDTIFSRVFMDTGLSLNVLPKSSLSKLTIEGLLMKPSKLVVRPFDGSRRSVIGEVDLPFKIGPHTFFITFYVMYIYPAYSCLLGRPLIHSVGAVTSTLHQRLKFFVNNKLVVVEGEEDIMLSHLMYFLYIKVGGEVHETSFQSFEVVNVEMVSPVKEVKTVEFPMVSWKDGRIVIEAGHPEGWGRVLDLPVNKHLSSLGYHSQPSTVKKTIPNVVEGQVLPLLDIFISVGHLVDKQISAVEEEEGGFSNNVGPVYQKMEGRELTKWTSTTIPEVTMIEK